MTERIYFSYERMEPFRYPDPRDLRMQLSKQMCYKYKDCKISKIPLSTEIILKTIKPKDPAKAEIILLKYKVLNVDWEEVRNIKDTTFTSKMFRWQKAEEVDYEGGADHGGGDPCGGGGHGGD